MAFKVVSFFLRRWVILASLCVVTPVGFAFKFYDGPGCGWFNDYGAGVVYEIFWCLVFFLIWLRRENISRIAVWVLAVTCSLEVMQLWQPPFLQSVRSTFVGSSLLGTTFVWWDFPHYVLGSGIGWLWMRAALGKAD